MRVAAFLLFAPFLMAQTVTLTGPGSVAAGGTATLTVSISGTAASNPAALQWSIGLPAGWTLGTPTTTSTDPAGDGVFCAAPICMVAGAIPVVKLTDGNIATIPVIVPATAPLGSVAIPLSGLFAADTAGLNINGLLTGALYSVTVAPSPCDVNGDGQINVVDVQAVILGAIKAQPCPISVANGGCTVVSVVQVILAAAGGSCKVP